MELIRLLKRFYYRLKNSDPVRSCPVYKQEGCSHVDGLCCDVRNCAILKKHMDKEWVGCASCLFIDTCSSKDFGLGCNNGIKAPIK